MNPLLYVYAILPAPATSTLESTMLRGIDGAPVGSIEAAGLAAAVSAVPASEFEAAPLNALVRSMDWLGPRAARHQEVNARLFALTDALVPLAFGTVYRDRSGVAAMLEGRQRALVATLESVRGRAEWVITLERRADQALAALEGRSAALRDVRAAIAEAAPGRSYLLSRQVAAVQRRELQIMDGQALAALEAVLPVAERVVAEPIEAGGATELLARLSVLILRESEGPWLSAVEEYQQQWQASGYDLRLTGPWPPYRFCGGGEERRYDRS